jgi:hypothetical protein
VAKSGQVGIKTGIGTALYRLTAAPLLIPGFIGYVGPEIPLLTVVPWLFHQVPTPRVRDHSLFRWRIVHRIDAGYVASRHCPATRRPIESEGGVRRHDKLATSLAAAVDGFPGRRPARPDPVNDNDITKLAIEVTALGHIPSNSF